MATTESGDWSARPPMQAARQWGKDALFLSTVQPTPRDEKLAVVIVLASLAAFLATAPFAQVPLLAISAFLPAYQSAVVLGDIVTFILLLGQYDILRSPGLLVIASGYLFNAVMAVFHALSFPGLFAPTGLLGSGPQTTAWLYFFWHGAFPLFIMAYVFLNNSRNIHPERRILLVWIATMAIAAVFASAFGLMLLATTGARWLPEIMSGDMDGRNKVIVSLVVWILNLAALGWLWRTKRTLLDMWLMVILCIWIFDVALAAVLNHGRYDVGWYAGRIYGLMAASLVLMILLLENENLYARLAAASARERAYLHHLHDPVITIDARGIISSANPALLRVLGYSVDEVLERNVSILMPEPIHRT